MIERVEEPSYSVHGVSLENPEVSITCGIVGSIQGWKFDGKSVQTSISTREPKQLAICQVYGSPQRDLTDDAATSPVPLQIANKRKG